MFDEMAILDFLNKNKLTLSALSIVVGIPLIIMSILSLMYKPTDVGITATAHDLLGDWAYWLVIIGIILSAVGIYVIIIFFRQLKEFKKLIDDPSKAKFIKNLDRTEELAWRLNPKYEKVVIERKRKYKIK
jgi:hypothetical protein